MVLVGIYFRATDQMDLLLSRLPLRPVIAARSPRDIVAQRDPPPALRLQRAA